jgi:hypothetical protein
MRSRRVFETRGTEGIASTIRVVNASLPELTAAPTRIDVMLFVIDATSCRLPGVNG